MNIGIDGSYAILKNNTTEGNYSKIVVDAISTYYPKSRIYIYTPRVDQRAVATGLALQGNLHVKQPRGAISKTLWMNYNGVVRELNRHHINLYHGTNGRLPLRIQHCKASCAVTVHSLAFKRFPGDYSWTDRAKQAFWTRKSCNLADRIITTSQHTRDDLIELMRIPAEKIEVVYPAVDKRFLQPIIDIELDTVRHKYRLPKRYILVISSLIKHKNVLAVLQAMKQLQDQDIELVLLGGETPYYKNVLSPYASENRLKRRLLHITRAHAGDIPSIYRLAEVLVAPSHLEGFGLTVIEAQACGLPVIASRGTSLEEAGGEAAMYFDPDNVDQLASCLNQLLADSNARQQLIDAGQQNIERFTQQILADRLIDVYHDVLGKH